MPPALELQIWLERYRGATASRFTFPVNADSISFMQGRSTIDVPGLAATRSRPGARVPVEITFSSFFPDVRFFQGNPGWINYDLSQVLDPWTTRRMLRQWQNEDNRRNGMTPLKFGIGPPANFAEWVILTQFDVETLHAHDLRFTITVKEMHKPPTVKRVKRGPRGSSRPTRRVNPQGHTKKVRTRRGEKLIQVAKRVYGSTGRGEVRILWEANRTVVGGDPHKALAKGVELKVPDIVGVTEKGVY